jgi:hypothetical protein
MMARIYHPALDRYVDVPETAVPIHRESGWILADEREADPSPVEPPKTASKPRATAAAKEKE